MQVVKQQGMGSRKWNNFSRGEHIIHRGDLHIIAIAFFQRILNSTMHLWVCDPFKQPWCNKRFSHIHGLTPPPLLSRTETISLMHVNILDR